jgi:transposase
MESPPKSSKGKLNARLVATIRIMLQNKSLRSVQKLIKKQYGVYVSHEGIRQAATGMTWKHVVDPPPITIKPNPSPNSKITDEQVIQMREEAQKRSWSPEHFAKQYDITCSSINQAISGRSFKHLNEIAPPVYRRNSKNRKANIHERQEEVLRGTHSNESETQHVEAPPYDPPQTPS